jgi:hypothetical protein
VTTEFFQTVMGHRFFEGQLPALIHALERIATVLEKPSKAKPAYKWKGTKPKYMCKTCHRFNVQHVHWVRVNTDEVMDVFGTWNQPDAAYCEDCGEPCEIEECGE